MDPPPPPPSAGPGTIAPRRWSTPPFASLLQEKGEPGGHKASLQPFSYAVIDNKPQPVRDFFAHHEGVRLFSWQPNKYGFGVMDRSVGGLWGLCGRACGWAMRL